MWELPFTSFKAGGSRWRIVVKKTPSSYVKELIRRGVELDPKSHNDLGCTVRADRVIILNEDHHHTQEDFTHTLWHEIFHVIWFTWGDHGAHNETEIDGKSAILAQILETAK